jgi:hydroxyethylthiazole kinase-like uncharacterized protein yjeF
VKYILSGTQMGILDKVAIYEQGMPGTDLMERAGEGVAAYCMQQTPVGTRVVILCGKGNNGGDGFVAGRHLLEAGYQVQVFLFGAAKDIDGDAAWALEGYLKLAGADLTEIAGEETLPLVGAALVDAALIVDALLGTGLHNDVRPLLAQAIMLINAGSAPVVAVDIPSGVDADTGKVLGRAVEAETCVTFAWPKVGHYLYPGAALAGDLRVVDIGIPKELAPKYAPEVMLLEDEDGPGLLDKRPKNAHKGTFGHARFLAGSAEMPGAAVLALHAALRAGAGLVSWAAQEETLHNAPQRAAEIMLCLAKEKTPGGFAQTLVDGVDALGIGPGLGQGAWAQEMVSATLSCAELPLCLDADALNILAQQPKLWQALKAPTVITPHPKEMARLSGLSVEAVEADRFGVARSFAAAHGCVVVLKGANTLVVAPNGHVRVIGAGNPGMATAGSGDVLTGIVTTFLAQGLETFDAAALGALVHACAGDRAAKAWGQTGLKAGDIIDSLALLWQEWGR